MCDENIINLSALYVYDILNWHKSLTDVDNLLSSTKSFNQSLLFL